MSADIWRLEEMCLKMSLEDVQRSCRMDGECSVHVLQQLQTLGHKLCKVVHVALSACGSLMTAKPVQFRSHVSTALLQQQKMSTASRILMCSVNAGLTALEYYFHLLYINFAAALSTDWSRSSMQVGIPASCWSNTSCTAQICCSTTLQYLNVQLYHFTVVSARIKR